MLGTDYLSLTLIRLASPGEWVHQGNGFSFIFPKGGLGKCVSGSVPRSIAPGDVLIFSAAAGGKLCVANGGELVFWFFSFNLEHLFPLLSCSELCLLPGITSGFKSPRLYPAETQLAAECHKLLADIPPRSSLDHRAQLLRVATTILTVEFKEAQPRHDGFVRVEEHMNQVFEKLSTSEILNLSIDDLARRFSCSRRHLNRLFHQHFGLSVAALRMEMRLLKAVSLLRDPDAKIINIAEQCGFNHLGLFNACFRRRFGNSPGQWRKMPVRLEDAPRVIESDPACRLRVNGLCPWSGKSPKPGPGPVTYVPNLKLASNLNPVGRT